MAHPLLRIVDDLVHSVAARAEFNADCTGFMKRYPLGKSEENALLTMDPHEIGAEIGVELGDALEPDIRVPAPTESPDDEPPEEPAPAERLYRLLRILDDLVHSAPLLEAFHADPGPVMDRYRLDAESRTALLTKNNVTIGERLGQELGGFKFMEGEFPPCQSGPSGSNDFKIMYPDPYPEVFCIDPPTVSSDAGKAVTVRGQSFPDDAVVRFTPELTYRNQKPTGTYRCCQIVVKLRATNAAGDYQVRVVSDRIGPIGKPLTLTLEAPTK